MVKKYNFIFDDIIGFYIQPDHPFQGETGFTCLFGNVDFSTLNLTSGISFISINHCKYNYYQVRILWYLYLFRMFFRTDFEPEILNLNIYFLSLPCYSFQKFNPITSCLKLLPSLTISIILILSFRLRAGNTRFQYTFKQSL